MKTLFNSTSWKTTLSAIIIILTIILAALFPATFTPSIVGSILALATAAGLYNAKDASITGIGSTATAIETVALPLLNQLDANSTNKAIEALHSIGTTLATSLANSAPVTSPKPLPAVEPDLTKTL